MFSLDKGMLVMGFRNHMEPLSFKEAEKLIRKISQYGSVIPSTHARGQMKERDYTTRDVFHILKHGKIRKREENPDGQHKYHVHGKDIEGHKGTVVVAIVNRKLLVIVTVLGGME
ncbi:MAG: DUF4258 domain-containing protein [Planctomycetaceae bacterium]|nr:MAG: DUF4258 domain-containing protein [Planctomycetaceae bacterium]